MCPNFHGNSGTHTRARVVNIRAHEKTCALAINCARAHLRLVCQYLSTDLYKKEHLVVNNYLSIYHKEKFNVLHIKILTNPKM